MKARYYHLVSKFAFNCNLRHYNKGTLPGGLEGQGGAVIVAVEVQDSLGAVSQPTTVQVISQWPKLESEAGRCGLTLATLTLLDFNT